MALKIRLRQQGCNNNTVYRVVVADVRSPRDGKYVEAVGWYNPYAAEIDKKIFIRSDRILHWVDKGAQLTENLKNLMGKAAPEILSKLSEKKLAQQTKRKAKRKAGQTAVRAS